MWLTGRQLRDAGRGLHIAAGIILLAIVFTPLGEAVIGQALRFVVAPLLVASGIHVAARPGHPPIERI